MSRWSTPGEAYAYETGYVEGMADVKRWIPVTERLPEPEKNVLVTLIDGRRRKINASWNGEKRYSIRIDKVIKYTDECDPFWAKGNTPSVIAWMPLPEPYRDDPCNGCGYLGESCVGRGLWEADKNGKKVKRNE